LGITVRKKRGGHYKGEEKELGSFTKYQKGGKEGKGLAEYLRGKVPGLVDVAAAGRGKRN